MYTCLHFFLLDNLWGVLGEWGLLWVFIVIHLWFAGSAISDKFFECDCRAYGWRWRCLWLASKSLLSCQPMLCNRSTHHSWVHDKHWCMQFCWKMVLWKMWAQCRQKSIKQNLIASLPILFILSGENKWRFMSLPAVYSPLVLGCTWMCSPFKVLFPWKPHHSAAPLTRCFSVIVVLSVEPI